MNVLIIPEDFRKDQYVLKPLIEAMMAAAGKPRAKVRVCQAPLMGDVYQALKWEKIQEVIARYPMVDLYLVLVDRDGELHRRERIDNLEKKAAESLPSSKELLGENAWQEVEVWVLAGHELPKEWAWNEVRAHPHPKEAYFEPFSRLRGLADAPESGRQALAKAAASRYERVRQLCPEDVSALEERIRAFVSRP